MLEAVGDDPGVVHELYAGSGTFTRHLAARAGARLRLRRRSGRGRARPATPPARPGRRARPTTPPTPWCSIPRARAPTAPTWRRPSARAAAIVYVSCDPQTLGRDARHLKADGFRLARAVALDLMPQTFHVEVVATFVPETPSRPSLDRTSFCPRTLAPFAGVTQW